MKPFSTVPNSLFVNFKEPTLNIDSLMKEDDKDLKKDYPFDVTSTLQELVGEYGFDSEEHTAITPDHYVLKMFRLRKKGQSGRGKPVFL